MDNTLLEKSHLGQTTQYSLVYSPELLFAIPRQTSRNQLMLSADLPFHGFDLWTGYELSWLNPKGKPLFAIIEIIFPFDTEYLIESKSLKLYLFSLAFTKFSDAAEVRQTIARDLSAKANGKIEVKISLQLPQEIQILKPLTGVSLDDLDISVESYTPNPELLRVGEPIVTETLTSDLLMSNCPVTQQPDWGSVQIHYHGPQINHAGLLNYIISFRTHNEFHENCVERMFVDIQQRCHPDKLSIYARYLRRGGLEINPFRSNFETDCERQRTPRQ